MTASRIRKPIEKLAAKLCRGGHLNQRLTHASIGMLDLLAAFDGGLVPNVSQRAGWFLNDALLYLINREHYMKVNLGQRRRFVFPTALECLLKR